jgi:hypothetical protein
MKITSIQGKTDKIGIIESKIKGKKTSLVNASVLVIPSQKYASTNAEEVQIITERANDV